MINAATGHDVLAPACPGMGYLVTPQTHSLKCSLGEQKTVVHQPFQLLHAAPLAANTQTNHANQGFHLYLFFKDIGNFS